MNAIGAKPAAFVLGLCLLAGCNQTKPDSAPVRTKESPTDSVAKTTPPEPPRDKQTLPKDNAPVRPGREKEVLAMLGMSSEVDLSGGDNVTVTELTDLFEWKAKCQKLLDMKGLAEGVPEAAGLIVKPCPNLRLVVGIKRNGMEADLAKVREKLGKEEGEEEGEYKSEALTWHKYGWLHLGEADGKVIAVRVDGKKLPATP